MNNDEHHNSTSNDNHDGTNNDDHNPLESHPVSGGSAPAAKSASRQTDGQSSIL